MWTIITIFAALFVLRIAYRIGRSTGWSEGYREGRGFNNHSVVELPRAAPKWRAVTPATTSAEELDATK